MYSMLLGEFISNEPDCIKSILLTRDNMFLPTLI